LKDAIIINEVHSLLSKIDIDYNKMEVDELYRVPLIKIKEINEKIIPLMTKIKSKDKEVDKISQILLKSIDIDKKYEKLKIRYSDILEQNICFNGLLFRDCELLEIKDAIINENKCYESLNKKSTIELFKHYREKEILESSSLNEISEQSKFFIKRKILKNIAKDFNCKQFKFSKESYFVKLLSNNDHSPFPMKLKKNQKAYLYINLNTMGEINIPRFSVIFDPKDKTESELKDFYQESINLKKKKKKKKKKFIIPIRTTYGIVLGE